MHCWFFVTFSILITLLALPIFYKKFQLVPHRKHGIHTVRTGFYIKQHMYIYIVDSDINLHIIDIFQPKDIRVLGQRGNYTQYKLFCTLTTLLNRTVHCCISMVKMVMQIRYNVTLYVHFLSRSILPCPFFSWILILYYFLLLVFIPFFSHNLRRMKPIRWGAVTYLLTPWRRVLLEKLTRSAASQEIPRILRNPKVHHRTRKRPPPVPILSQLHPVPTTRSQFLQVHLTHRLLDHFLNSG